MVAAVAASEHVGILVFKKKDKTALMTFVSGNDVVSASVSHCVH